MRGRLGDRYARCVVEHSKWVVLLVLVLTGAIAAGAVVGEVDDAGIGEFETDSEETEALEYVEENYADDDAVVSQVVIRGEGWDDPDGVADVLTRESFLDGLYFQQTLRDDEAGETLTDEGIVALENVVATGAVFEDRAEEANGPPDTTEPTLDEQIEALEDRSEGDVKALLDTVLDPDGDSAGDQDPYDFLPSTYDPGETDSESRIAFVFQEDESGEDEEPEAAYEAQLSIESAFEQRFDDGFVFGQAITDEANANAVGDSFAIITPVALVLVLGVLGVTYRDVTDVLIGLLGIGVVMAWLAGIQGWLEIPSSQLLIAVPFLLIGLSIDYSLHVVMRYREARAGVLDRATDSASKPLPDAPDERSIRGGMTVGLAGVVLALAAATVSTGVGFLSNAVSPLAAIQDFALLAGGGIFATFVAFGLFVPALKVEVDGLLEGRFGRDRAKRPFGVTPGPINGALSTGVSLARRAPLAVVVVALVLAGAGAAGATGIDTEFNEADFLPQDPPEIAKELPGPFAPDTYTVADDAEYLSENFQDPDSQAEILLRGDVSDPTTLAAINDALEDRQESNAATGAGTGERETVALRADGDPAVDSPILLIEDLAASDDDVAEALEERDDSGDGLPDEDVSGLYDVAFEADSDESATLLERTDDGEYESARLIVSVRGDASSQSVAEDVRALAEDVEEDAPVTAVATGGPVTTAVVQDALLETLVGAFAVTLVVILAFLTVLNWVRHRALSLGVVTLVPVVAALAWLLGTMALFDVPFNSETAVITSLAIGLGVDYSIHVVERFVAEAERAASLDAALSATVTGTGGALLASAATTAAGFGVLALALAPPLQRFGVVTGLAIVFAFVACLTVLPCLLILRARSVAWADRF